MAFLGISLALDTLDTFGGEATCSSPDVVAVWSSNGACFVALWLSTGFGAVFWPFWGISLALDTLDTFGGEATCSSPDVVAVWSANGACFVALWLSTSFGAAFWPFLGISVALDTFVSLGITAWIFESVLTWCCSGAYSEESEESPSFSLSEVDSSSKSLIFIRIVSAFSAV